MSLLYDTLSVATILLITLFSASALCGREGVRITGSAAVKPIAIGWARAYGAQCGWQVFVDPPNGESLSTNTSMIIIEERGDISIDMLCSNSSNQVPLRISNADIIMSDRPIFNQASGPTGSYNCTGINGSSSQKFIQVEVAKDSVSVIVSRSGIASDCINILGGGLTQDQLRWIISTNTTSQLQAMGWSSTSLSKGTGPLDERRWSRLHMRCSRSLIPVGISSNYYSFFQSALMRNISQGISSSLITSSPMHVFKNDEDIASFVLNNGAAIGYIGYPSFVTKQNTLRAVAVQSDDGNFVVPSETSISSNSYRPLSRRLYMSVRRDRLIMSRYFLEFAYSNYGDEITRGNGYTQVATLDQFQMFGELGSVNPACLGNQTSCLIHPAPINTNCISLASIICCSGDRTLNIFVSENTESYFNIWKKYFEMACSNTKITLTKSGSPYDQTCKIFPEFSSLVVAATGSKINNPILYPVSDPKFTYKCSGYSPKRSLLEFKMAPSPERFFYTNSASSARSRTRCFLEFALCTLGTQVVKCNGLSFNDFAVTTEQMCNRNKNY
jgi:ABC-type phosphate transport system substrate-binding protein